MKNLIVAIICILALLVPWELYDMYSTEITEDYCTALEDEIIPAIENGDWPKAQAAYDTIYSSWNKYKDVSDFFLNAQAINETGNLINKTLFHITMEDSSNAASSAAQLSNMLKYLHENEMASAGNIL